MGNAYIGEQGKVLREGVLLKTKVVSEKDVLEF